MTKERIIGPKTQWSSNGLGNSGSRGGAGGGGVSLPESSSIIYQHDIYDGSTTPQTGSYTFARTGTAVYADSASTLAEASSGAEAINAMQWGQGVAGTGMLIAGREKNFCTHSEDFTNAAWVNIGTGTATQTANTATDPMGTTLADTLSHSGGGSDTGISDDLAITAASMESRFSVYLKASTGSPTVKIRLTDSTDSELAETWCELSSTEWRRFECYKEFSASATGNVFAQIIHGTNTIYAWGAMGEDTKNSTARRDRTQGAGPYVRTSGSAVTSNSDSYAIPNSIYDQMATRGTISLWYNGKQPIKGAQQGGSSYVFSAGSEQFALILAASHANFWINSGNRVKAGEQYSYTNDAWVHYTCTWDTDSDEYQIWINGKDRSESVGTTTSITTGTNKLFIGNRSSLPPQSAGDGLVSQVVIWDTVLSDADILQVYNTKKSLFVEAAPGSGVIFEVDFASSIVPTTYSGTPQMWFTRDSVAGYNPTSSTWDETIHGVPQVGAYAWGESAGQGLPGTGGMTNLCLQSEDLATTWTKINGAETITANDTTSPDTTDNADKVVSGTAAHGVEQSLTGATAASKDYIFSIFMKRTGGSVTPSIRIEDSTNSEGTSATLTPTVSSGEWDRYFVYHEGSAGATGDINVKIITGDTTGSDLHFWGAMVQERNPSTPASTASPPTITANSPSQYIPTTTTSAATNFSAISYAHNNAHFNGKLGTALVWMSNPHIDADMTLAPYGHTLYSVRGHGATAPNEGIYMHLLHNVSGDGIALRYWYNGISRGYQTLGRTIRNQWNLYVITWDTDGADFRTYVDGALVDTDTTVGVEPLDPTNFWTSGDGGISSLHTSSNTDNVDGVIGKLTVYGESLSTAEILAIYNDEKATYGR